MEAQFTKTVRPVVEVLQQKHLDMQVTPMENLMCVTFEKYEDVPEMVPLEFTEYDAMWVESKLSGAVGALGAEAIELRNCLILFGCMSEELRVIIAILDGCMANSSLPWSTYCALMACSLVALDKGLGVRPVGIRETICRSLAKIFLRGAGDQAKMACGNLQMLSGLDSSIEVDTHAAV